MTSVHVDYSLIKVGYCRLKSVEIVKLIYSRLKLTVEGIAGVGQSELQSVEVN